MQTFEKLWPIATAEDWDRPGLMVGNPAQEIRKVLLSVDVTAAVIQQAAELDAELILSHHPVLLRGVHELGELTLKGNLVSQAIRSSIAIYSAHTNADIAKGGVSESFAKAIGLEKLRALDEVSGHGCVGEIEPMPLIDFARKVARTLPSVAQGVRVAGDQQKLISRVGLVGGAGDGFLLAAQNAGIDVFITSDLRHHPAQDFMEQSRITSGPALIDVAHWAAEWLWLEQAADQLSGHHPDIEFIVSDINTDPWDFAVMQ